MKKTLLLIASLAVTASACHATWQYSPIFYNGDMNGAAFIPCQRTSMMNSRVFDNFWITNSLYSKVSQAWGNFVVNGAIPTSAYFEIRRGLSPGVGGTLVASGIYPATATWTGRTGMGFLEYRMVSAIPGGIQLTNGEYWMLYQPINGGRVLLSSTIGNNAGPAGDPNPVPVNRKPNNSYHDSPPQGVCMRRSTATGPTACVRGSTSPGLRAAGEEEATNRLRERAPRTIRGALR